MPRQHAQITCISTDGKALATAANEGLGSLRILCVAHMLVQRACYGCDRPYAMAATAHACLHTTYPLLPRSAGPEVCLREFPSLKLIGKLDTGLEKGVRHMALGGVTDSGLRTVCINDKDNARNQSKYPHASSITYQDRILSHLRSTVRHCDPTVSVSGAPSLICISSDQRTSGGSIHPSFPSSIQGARGALHVHLAALQWPSCCLTAVYHLHRLSTALSPIR